MSEVLILKTDPLMFDAVVEGKKKAEFRQGRGFKVSDRVCLVRNGTYPLESCLIEITHIVEGSYYGIPDGYCMFSFEKVTNDTANN